MEAVPLSASTIRSQLTTRVIGQPLYYFAATTSTNTEAKRLATSGAPEGTVLVADEQTAGRGRLGRRWSAPPNTSLLFSVLFRPPVPPRQAPRLTMLCSLAAVEVIEQVTRLPVAIKWPNDLVVTQSRGAAGVYRKLGGLLTESSIEGGALSYVVVGVGINVNVDPVALGPVMMPATSLMEESGRRVDRTALLVAILHRIEDLHPQVMSEQLFHDWAGRLETLGRRVAVTSGGSRQQMEGVVEGVNPDGAIHLRDLAGNLHLVTVGDVTLQESGS